MSTKYFAWVMPLYSGGYVIDVPDVGSTEAANDSDIIFQTRKLIKDEDGDDSPEIVMVISP